MSEKEIINVSDCEFYGYDGVCKLYSGSICSKDCSNYPNCYFKQLKRKEQKCERLKEEIKTNGFGCFNIEMSEQLDQLKKTLTEIKEICKFNFTMTTTNLLAKTIIQKISECEANND